MTTSSFEVEEKVRVIGFEELCKYALSISQAAGLDTTLYRNLLVPETVSVRLLSLNLSKFVLSQRFESFRLRVMSVKLMKLICLFLLSKSASKIVFIRLPAKSRISIEFGVNEIESMSMPA